MTRIARRAWIGAAAVGFTAIVALVGGLFAGAGAAAAVDEGARPDRVVLISAPRLTWEDLDGAETPALSGFMTESAYALASVRAIGPGTGLAEGYVTVGAGNRATVTPSVDLMPRMGPAGASFSPAMRLAELDARDKLFGAEPGSLGEALRTSGLRTGVVALSGESWLTIADRAGSVDRSEFVRGIESLPAAFTEVSAGTDVTLVELPALELLEHRGGLGAYSSHPLDATESRRGAVSELDRDLGSVLAATVPGDLVVLFSPAAPGNAGHLTVFALRGPGVVPGVARSATTRRDGYVTLSDIAPTVLDALGIEQPDAMNGTLITGGHGPVYDASTAHRLAERSARALYRDRTVGPVSVVFIVGQVLVYVAAGIGTARRRPGLVRSAVVGSLVVLALPTVAFLSGIVAYRRLPLALYVLAVVTASAVLAVAARRLTRRAVLAALGLVTLGWLVQIVDIVSGGALQLDTPFGYSPIVAGRFQGYGNLSFALVASSALVVMTGVGLVPRRPEVRSRLEVVDNKMGAAVHAEHRGWPRFAVMGVAAVVGVVTLVADGAPSFGADVGGVLALLPAVCVALLILAGRRVGFARLTGLGAVAALALGGFALLDFQRDESERTHLARFLTRLADGEGGLIVRRKLDANLHILTSSIWTWLLPVAAALLVVLARRPSGPLAALRRDRYGVDACLRSAAVLGLVGFAANDSGIAIPAMMCGVLLPWLVVLAGSEPT